MKEEIGEWDGDVELLEVEAWAERVSSPSKTKESETDENQQSHAIRLIDLNNSLSNPIRSVA